MQICGYGRLAAVALLIALLSAGCRSPAPEPSGAQPAAEARFPADVYDNLADRGPVYALDPDASSVRVFVYRGGPLGRFGHNHVMAVTDFRGAVYLPDELAEARFDVAFDVHALAVDRPADREAAAGAFDSALDAAAVGDTRANMLGPQVLDAEQYPRIGLRSVAVSGELPVLDLTVEVVLHGHRQELSVPVWIDRADEWLVAEGHFRLRQSRFGIEPFSAAAGALRVRDVLGVRFRLIGERGTP